MDLSSRVLLEFNHRHRQAEFLRMEFENCSRSVLVASTLYHAGRNDSAARTISDAEQGYETVLRMLSDPQCSKYLTIKTIQEFTAKMGQLRKTLDHLQQKTEELNNKSK